jgi:suppressor of ftsI
MSDGLEVANATREPHLVHIHQVHFLGYAENDRLRAERMKDAVNVPRSGSVDIIVDSTDPVIRGGSLFRCHLLNLEDQGMMAETLLE